MMGGRASLIFIVALLALLVALPGCGARTGRVPTDGSIVPRKDGSPRRDSLLLSDGPPARDRAVPVDTRHPDSCLPIPASSVRGFYKGSWKGSSVCPNSPPVQLSGTLGFGLQPTGSSSFHVGGKMIGVISGGPGSPGIPFYAKISGSMGCTALSASLDVWVTGTSLRGTLVGTFSAGPPIGFSAGGWKVDNIDGSSCTASGKWFANQ